MSSVSALTISKVCCEGELQVWIHLISFPSASIPAPNHARLRACSHDVLAAGPSLATDSHSELSVRDSACLSGHERSVFECSMIGVITLSRGDGASHWKR